MKENNALVEPSSGEKLLMGTTDEALNKELLRKTALASLPKKDRNEEGVRVLQAFILGMQPENPIEAMVHSQLYALHSHAMEMMADAQKSISVDIREQYLKMANKLVKTFNNSLEALNKYKCRGLQTIRVENVNVNDGGQAIVSGTVQKG